MGENFPNLGQEIGIQFQESQGVPTKMNLKTETPGHIVVKMTKGKDKEKILKAAKRKQ